MNDKPWIKSYPAGMRWDIETLRRDLGFVPRDGEAMQVPPVQRVKAGLAWVRDDGLPRLGSLLAGARW